MQPAWRGLYAIADTIYLDGAHIASAVERALQGGARVIQYRDKKHTAAERLLHAARLRAVCAEHGAYFIVNDDVELARAARADGVHVGRHDAAVENARRVLGADAIVGVSCYNELARAERAVLMGASYVAFGSFYPSRTKPDAVRAEPTLLTQARARFAVPLVAIGGITPENGAALITAGADLLAVISGVFDQSDVEAAARRYASLFHQGESS
ncbi:MAG: thiamine phosphate synthase [Sulfurifustaceae bacterium]